MGWLIFLQDKGIIPFFKRVIRETLAGSAGKDIRGFIP